MSRTPQPERVEEEDNHAAQGEGEDTREEGVGGPSPAPRKRDASPDGGEDPPRDATPVANAPRPRVSIYQPDAHPDCGPATPGPVASCRAEALWDTPVSLRGLRDLIKTNQWQARHQLTTIRIVLNQVRALSHEAQEQRTRILVQVEHLARRIALQDSLRAASEKRRMRIEAAARNRTMFDRLGPMGVAALVLTILSWMAACATAQPVEFRSSPETVQRALSRLIDPVITRGHPPSLEEGEVLMALAKGPDVMLQALAARALAWQGYSEYDPVRDVLDYLARQAMAYQWAQQRLQELSRNQTGGAEQAQLRDFLRSAAVGLPSSPGNVTLNKLPVEIGRAKRGHPSEALYIVEAQPFNGTDAYLGEPPSGRPPTRTAARWTSTELKGIAALPGSPTVTYAPQVLPLGGGANTSSTERTSGPTELEFTAYDCSYPQDMSAVTLPSASDCNRRPAPPITHEAVQQYSLLQLVPTTSFSVKFCSLRRSKMPIYCGAYNHQTVITSDIWHNHPVEISPEDCRRYWHHQEIKVRVKPTDSQWREVSFQLALNDTTQLRYDSHGKSWVESNDGRCEGVSWHSQAQNRWVENTIQTVGDEVTMSMEEALVDGDGRVDLPDRKLTLPPECEYQSGYCQTREGTFVWEPEPETIHCPLFLARTPLNGTEVDVAEDGRITTIFSDNKNLVRLVKKRAITMCNHQVHPTNFDNLFLVANPEHLPKALLRPVPDHAVSLTTYFNQQSNWLRGYFDETVTEYMGRLIQQRCKAEQEKRALEWAELAGKQAAITAGETISLGDGMFATATGEAWRYYRCRAVRVIGVNRDKCYNALPVIASAGDTERFLRSSDLPAETPLYMEPNTRMLTALAVEFPCSPHLAPLYQNDRKTWIQATPSLLPAAEPRPLDTVDLVTFDLIGKGKATGPDFEEGGIYPIDALKRMEDVRSQHKKAAIGTNELAKVVGQFYHPSSLPNGKEVGFWPHVIGQAVPELPTLQKMATGWFWTIFGLYGNITQFLVGTYILFQIAAFAWKVAMACVFPDPNLPKGAARCCGGIMPGTLRCLVDYFHPTGRRYQERRGRKEGSEMEERGRPYAHDTVDDPLMPAPPPAPIVRGAQRPYGEGDASAPPSYHSFSDQGVYPTLRRMVNMRSPRRRTPIRRSQRAADLTEGGSVAAAENIEKPEDVRTLPTGDAGYDGGAEGGAARL